MFEVSDFCDDDEKADIFLTKNSLLKISHKSTDKYLIVYQKLGLALAREGVCLLASIQTACP